MATEPSSPPPSHEDREGKAFHLPHDFFKMNGLDYEPCLNREIILMPKFLSVGHFFVSFVVGLQ
jgi:hypothetical protein